jgi:TM2 domain-containing membrane protein YozV
MLSEASVGVKLAVIAIFFFAFFLAALDRIYVGEGSVFYFPLLMFCAIGVPVILIVLIIRLGRRREARTNKR